MVDAKHIIERSRGNESCAPVKTARYTIDVVMNEEDPLASDATLVKLFSDEFQRALDAGFFEAIRYDGLDFDVKRELLDEAPAGGDYLKD